MWRETTRNENKKLPGSRNKETQYKSSSACWKWKEPIVWEKGGGEGFATRVGGFLKSMNNEICV